MHFFAVFSGLDICIRGYCRSFRRPLTAIASICRRRRRHATSAALASRHSRPAFADVLIERMRGEARDHVVNRLTGEGQVDEALSWTANSLGNVASVAARRVQYSVEISQCPRGQLMDAARTRGHRARPLWWSSGMELSSREGSASSVNRLRRRAVVVHRAAVWST